MLSDVKVRRAIAMGIDRQTIADAMLGPLGGDSTKLDNHIFMRNQEGYQDNAGDLSEPDLDAANAQLDEAGWVREGEGTRNKDGQELSIRFVIPSGVATSAQSRSSSRACCRDRRGRADRDRRRGPVLRDVHPPRRLRVHRVLLLGKPFPISSYKSSYANPQGDDIRQNFARVGSPQIDALFDQATRSRTGEARDVANEIDAAIWREVHSLTLDQRPDITATIPSWRTTVPSASPPRDYAGRRFHRVI